MKLLKLLLLSILYVLLALGLHLYLIYLLKIQIEDWGPELLKFTYQAYFVPVCLGFTNSFLFVRTLRVKYHVIWFLSTTIPSFLLILFFKAMQRTGEYEQAVVTIEFFPEYQVEMLILLPIFIFILQFILTLFYVIRIRKNVSLLKA